MIQAEAVEPKGDYDLHIKVPDQMSERLRDAAELDYKMWDVPKSDPVDLMDLFIGWGFAIQKKWLDLIGCR